MSFSILLRDEKNLTGKTLAFSQGDIKTIRAYLFDKDGAPYPAASVGEVIVKISKGLQVAALQKTLGNADVTLLTGLGGTIGFQFALSAADTASLPVSSTIAMSIKIEDNASPTTSFEVDVPNAFDVSAPLVP